MSVVVAICEPSRGSWMLADSQVCYGGTPVNTARKIVRVGKICVGFSGNMVDAQIISAHLRALPIDHRENIEQIAGQIRTISDRYHLWQMGGERRLLAGHLLVASSSRVAVLGQDLCVIDIPARQLAAIGSGADYALGAGFALTARGDDPVTVATVAVQAAIANDLDCGGPIQTESLSTDGQ